MGLQTLPAPISILTLEIVMNKYIRLLAVALAACLLFCSCALEPAGKGEGDDTTPTPSVPPVRDDFVYEPFLDGETVVCLDAGHGFRDIGTSSEYLEGTEAEVNLQMVKLLQNKLEAAGCTVILTHDGESFPKASEIKALADKAGVKYDEEKLIENDIFSAYERAIYVSAIAEDKAIDLFVSLHVNSIEGHPEHRQYEIDYYEKNPHAEALSVLCEDIAAGLDNKTVIYADKLEDAFIVTKGGVHPSILIEMGYASNKTDAENLNSPQWRDKFCTHLADTFVAWGASFEEK